MVIITYLLCIFLIVIAIFILVVMLLTFFSIVVHNCIKFLTRKERLKRLKIESFSTETGIFDEREIELLLNNKKEYLSYLNRSFSFNSSLLKRWIGLPSGNKFNRKKFYYYGDQILLEEFQRLNDCEQLILIF